MNYPYTCPACAFSFDVTKSVTKIDDPEHCEKCNAVAERRIAASQSFYGANDWDTAHYSPAFGKVVKNNREARALAKQMGMTEVGTEKPEKIAAHFEKAREEKRERSYEDIHRSLTSLGEVGS